MSTVGRVIAVGNAGVVYYTTTSTATTPTFTLATSVTTSDLYCIASYGANYAMAAGTSGTVILTKNNGVTWSKIASSSQTTVIPSTVSFKFHSITMLSQAVVYLAGSNGYIYKTGTITTAIAAVSLLL